MKNQQSNQISEIKELTKEIKLLRKELKQFNETRISFLKEQYEKYHKEIEEFYKSFYPRKPAPENEKQWDPFKAPLFPGYHQTESCFPATDAESPELELRELKKKLK